MCVNTLCEWSGVSYTEGDECLRLCVSVVRGSSK